MPITLPIDSYIPDLLASLQLRKRLVLVAEPGAGKTTRVPPALAGVLEGAVWVLQPRRLAAAVAARRVAQEQGWELGGEVGYHFRFERKESEATRVLFLTEGMFLRRLQSNPSLKGVAAVVLDEFHERSLDADMAFAMLRSSARDDLTWVVMSATLDSGAVAKAMDHAPVTQCPGRRFAVAMSYLEEGRSDPDEALERRVRRGLKKIGKVDGHTLVFLPGVGEIRRTAALLSRDPVFEGHRIIALHGGLSADQQQAALAPSERPKILLATNVAETSLTVPGVRAVLDSGFARKQRFHPWNGLSSLVTLPASQAAMTQRAGRAGREAEGLCLRLCSAAEYKARAAYDPPEIALADLASSYLNMRAAGMAQDPAWLDPPPPAAAQAAKNLLENLGATAEGSLTKLGNLMASVSAHPRLAAVLCLAGANCADEERELARCVTFLSEEKPRRLDFFKELENYQPRGAAARLEERCHGWINQAARLDLAPQSSLPWHDRLARALLFAFSSQVGLAKKGSDKRGEIKFALASGGQAAAFDESLHLPAGLYLLMAIVELKDHRGQGRLPKVSSLLPIDEDWLLDLFEDEISDKAELHWDAKREKVEVLSQLKYGELVLAENQAGGGSSKAIAAILIEEAKKKGLEKFFGQGQPQRYLARREAALMGDGSLDLPGAAQLEETLFSLAENCVSFEQLIAFNPMGAAMAALSGSVKNEFETLAPKKLKLPSGRETSIQYEKGKPPWVQGYMQDFFGLSETPPALVVHLLGPNKRAVQVTSDLAGFWVNHYPKLRQELSRKYPRHYWPEDPSKADAKLLKRHRPR